MVELITLTDNTTIYSHVAWSNEEDHSDIFLSYQEDARYEGRYEDQESTDTSDSNKYKWVDLESEEESEEEEKVEEDRAAEEEEEELEEELEESGTEEVTLSEEDSLEELQDVSEEVLELEARIEEEAEQAKDAVEANEETTAVKDLLSDAIEQSEEESENLADIVSTTTNDLETMNAMTEQLETNENELRMTNNGKVGWLVENGIIKEKDLYINDAEPGSAVKGIEATCSETGVLTLKYDATELGAKLSAVSNEQDLVLSFDAKTDITEEYQLYLKNEKNQVIAEFGTTSNKRLAAVINADENDNVTDMEEVVPEENIYNRESAEEEPELESMDSDSEEVSTGKVFIHQTLRAVSKEHEETDNQKAYVIFSIVAVEGQKIEIGNLKIEIGTRATAYRTETKDASKTATSYIKSDPEQGYIEIGDIEHLSGEESVSKNRLTANGMELYRKDVKLAEFLAEQMAFYDSENPGETYFKIKKVKSGIPITQSIETNFIADFTEARGKNNVILNNKVQEIKSVHVVYRAYGVMGQNVFEVDLSTVAKDESQELYYQVRELEGKQRLYIAGNAECTIKEITVTYTINEPSVAISIGDGDNEDKYCFAIGSNSSFSNENALTIDYTGVTKILDGLVENNLQLLSEEKGIRLPNGAKVLYQSNSGNLITYLFGSNANYNIYMDWENKIQYLFNGKTVAGVNMDGFYDEKGHTIHGEYNIGDTISIGVFSDIGLLTSGKTKTHIKVPICKPVSQSVTKLTTSFSNIIYRQNGNYVLNTSSGKISSNSSKIKNVTTVLEEGFIRITIETAAQNAVNNEAISVWLEGLKIKLTRKGV